MMSSACETTATLAVVEPEVEVELEDNSLEPDELAPSF
jgi:hypothetical protein